ncbi:uncharacterized protein Triagg1_210 [Trichoderma aggressivum f. europaeum]|uniref:Uncharacterized protein n=1 Tax=Trichoderma aggressivum f. europaeum TaxID=173218 RepID=A0AAE1JIG5_9HYPO|nr:hypothetical protein Triagg1_210 [Trichoderma aggressivum f. europaeum]
MLARKERRGEEGNKKVEEWKKVLDATMKGEKEEDENRSEAPQQIEEKTAVQKEESKDAASWWWLPDRKAGAEAMRWDRHKEEKKKRGEGTLISEEGGEQPEPESEELADTEALASFAGPETEPETESYKRASAGAQHQSEYQKTSWKRERETTVPKATARKGCACVTTAACGRRRLEKSSAVLQSGRWCKSTGS